MKKSCIQFISGVVFIFMTLCSSAQNIGIVAGFDRSGILSDDTHYTSKGKFGVHLGCLLETSLMIDDIVLQTGLIYTQKGTKYETSYWIGYDEIKSDGKKSLNYLDIPLLAGYKHNFEKIGVYAVVGPMFSIALSGKLKAYDPFSDSEYESRLKFDGKDHRRIDIGFNIGTGVMIKERFRCGLNLCYGLTNIEAIGIEQSNIVLQLNASYFIADLGLINLKKKK